MPTEEHRALSLEQARAAVVFAADITVVVGMKSSAAERVAKALVMDCMTGGTHGDWETLYAFVKDLLDERRAFLDDRRSRDAAARLSQFLTENRDLAGPLGGTK